MPTTVITWNSRGNPWNDATKKAKLRALVQAADYVLVQECGGLLDNGAYNDGGVLYNVSGAIQAGSFNNRCSTAIVSRNALPGVATHTAQSSSGRFGIYAEIGGGPGGWVLGTLHSNSGGAGAGDLTAFLQDLGQRYGGDRRIVIGGDFNYAPTADVLNVGTDSRPQFWQIGRSGQNTWVGSGTYAPSELDFFAYRWNGEGRAVRDADTGNSDHYPVLLSLP